MERTLEDEETKKDHCERERERQTSWSRGPQPCEELGCPAGGKQVKLYLYLQPLPITCLSSTSCLISSSIRFSWNHKPCDLGCKFLMRIIPETIPTPCPGLWRNCFP